MAASANNDQHGDRMKITCSHCGFSAFVDSSRVPVGISKANCPKCHKSFSVSKEAPTPAVTPASVPSAPAPAPVPSTSGFSVICPSCGHEQELSAGCNKCGLIFARYRANNHKGQEQATPPDPTAPRRRAILPMMIAAAIVVVVVGAFVLFKDRVTWNDVPGVAKHDVIAVAAGYSHTIAAKSNGTVWVWGSNRNGELGNGMLDEGSQVPQKVADISGVVSVAAGRAHSLALKADGTLWGWGNNDHGQLGDTSGVLVMLRPVKIADVEGVAAVATGDSHTVILKKDGTLYSFGDGLMGQLGTGTTDSQVAPTQITGVTDVTAVACGRRFTVALRKDGTVWTWGENFNGQLGDGSFDHRHEPVQVKDLRDVTAIAAGEDFTVALKKDGTVWGWGMLFTDSNKSRKSAVPMKLPNLDDVAAIKSGYWHMIALKKNGTVWSWGRNGQNQLGRGTPRHGYLVEGYELNAITSIYAGGFNSFVEKRDGSLLGWGLNNNGQLGDGTKISKLAPSTISFAVDAVESTSTAKDNAAIAPIPPPDEPIQAVAAGFEHTVALGRDGTVWTWGRNEEGQLGNRANNSSSKPQQVFIQGRELLDNVVAVAAGAYHSVAVRSDGSVWMWGQHFAQSSGSVTERNRHLFPPSIPCTKVGGIEGAAVVEGGYASFICLGKDGRVWIWGLGNGQHPLDAKVVPGLTDVTAISAGGRHFVALKADGTVWTWGNNDEGQLGDGTRSSKEQPRQVPKLTNVVRIVASTKSTVVVKGDGTVWAWGAKIHGTLPDGTNTVSSLVPVQIAGLRNIADVAAPRYGYENGSHFLALAQDGSVWSWGFNNFGQLGQGTKNPDFETVPHQIAELKDVSQLSAGGAHSLALLHNGSLWSWGKNFYGQLGSETHVDSPLPVQVVLKRNDLPTRR